MFKWFWTIFSLGAPEACCIKHSDVDNAKQCGWEIVLIIWPLRRRAFIVKLLSIGATRPQNAVRLCWEHLLLRAMRF